MTLSVIALLAMLIMSESIQKRLLSESDLDLSEAVKLAETMEAAQRNAQKLRQEGGPAIPNA